MIFHTAIYCIGIICSTFSCFNTELSCVIVCNTCIANHIYHFDNKSQYVVQLSMFFLETLLTDVNTYLCLTVTLHQMEKCTTTFFLIQLNVMNPSRMISPFLHTVIR